MKLHIFEFAVVAARLLPGVRMHHEIAAGLGAPDRVKNLRARARRLRDHVQPLVSPMGRHLTAAGTWILGRADCLQQHFLGRSSKSQAKRSITIIREEPVVSRLHGEAGGCGHSLMSRARNLKEDFLLAFQHDLAIVKPPRGVHHAI